MAKQNVTVRLEGDLVEWADRYAAERRWKRTTVFEAALEALRGDAAGGVPDPPVTRVENLRETSSGEVVRDKPDRSASFQAPVTDYAAAARERQQKLNDAKYGRKR